MSKLRELLREIDATDRLWIDAIKNHEYERMRDREAAHHMACAKLVFWLQLKMPADADLTPETLNSLLEAAE